MSVWTWVGLIYLMVMACVGQWLLIDYAFAWMDRRFDGCRTCHRPWDECVCTSRLKQERDQAVVAMREIQRKYVRADKA